MTASLPADTVVAPGARPRPRVHFTAEDGWINDPYGLVWTGDRYHLFYQAIPGRVTWAPQCTWGHAQSTDLVHWEPLAPALVPQEFELGCWSGSVVPDSSGLRLFYTRVSDPDWARGAIAVGRPSTNGWIAHADDVLIPGPPDELGVQAMRDPYVFQYGEQWLMIVGAALRDGSAAAVQYRSRDLETWTCDGLLAARHSTPADAVWTGSMWECPQLFRLGDHWVLLVSVWHDDTLHHVAAAVGDFDGQRFVPRSWQQLSYGNSAYAMTAFLDRAGRRCVMSWLREEPQNDPSLLDRAGAHSVAALLTCTDTGTLVLTPHPDLRAPAGSTRYPPAPTAPTQLAIGTRAAELTLTPTAGLQLRVVAGADTLATLTFGATGAELHINRPERDDAVMPVSGEHEMRLLVDADLLEVFGAGGYGAFRIGVNANPDATAIVLAAPHPEVCLRTF